MGWSIGYDEDTKRDIGYGVPAYCDAPGCFAEIDRGIDYACGGDHGAGSHGCGLYFCYEHKGFFGGKCPRCAASKSPYKRLPPEHPEWILHKLMDPSWARWRDENSEETETLKSALIKAAKPQQKR